MRNRYLAENLLLKWPTSTTSRFRGILYRLLGMALGVRNRFEGRGRCRRLNQIQVGSYNCFSEGFCLWPIDEEHVGVRIQIGDGNYFNRGCMIEACGKITIGNNNLFGPDVYIADSNHNYSSGAPKSLPMNVGRIKIGDNCWIGAKTIILKNVDIGDGAVIGAGAVVTKSVAAGTVVAGVPARPIR